VKASTLSSVLAVALVGCAGLPVATLQAPAPLDRAAIQTLPVGGLRSGGFTLNGPLPTQVRYTRAADRLSLFDSVVLDSASLTLQLDDRSYRCQLRRTDAQRGVLALAVRPMQLRCQGDGERSLELDELKRATHTQREGRFRDGDTQLQIESLHTLQGSPLPLQQAGGYLLRHEGQPVAVLDLLDSAARVRSIAQGQALQTAVRDATLLLALHGDPSR
jgi:hypothetical protein